MVSCSLCTGCCGWRYELELWQPFCNHEGIWDENKAEDGKQEDGKNLGVCDNGTYLTKRGTTS